MATKNEALRNAIADAFGTAWDQGANPSPSELRIFDAGDTLIVTFELPSDAFGAAASGLAQMNGVPLSGVAVAGGIAEHADLVSADGTFQLTGLTVAESDAQLVLDNVDINQNQTVRLYGFNWTDPETV